MITGNKSNKPQIVFGLSILTAIYWCLGQLIDVYDLAVVGAIFEILWLPMLAMLVILPIICVINLVKEKFKVNSLYLYSFLIILSTFIYLTLKS